MANIKTYGQILGLAFNHNYVSSFVPIGPYFPEIKQSKYLTLKIQGRGHNYWQHLRSSVQLICNWQHLRSSVQLIYMFFYLAAIGPFIICAKYGKNSSRTVHAVEQTQQDVPYFSSFIAKSWLNDLEDIGRGQRSLHRTHPLMLEIICAK